MKVHILFFICVSAILVLFGCGADVPSEPGEEVVSDKWIEPKDIGKEYSIGIEDIKRGETYTLDTGETFTIGDNQGVHLLDDGRIQAVRRVRSVNVHGEVFETKVVGTIVPNGDPIVFLRAWSDVHRDFGPVTKDDNVKDYMGFRCSVRIDRILDYHLPIYLEYRAHDLEALGGQVHVTRFICVVPKGELFALVEGGNSYSLDVGKAKEHQKAYIRILPYTELKKIDLPAKTGLPDGDKILPVEISSIPEGHTFRPYRIRSSSFLMGKPEIEDNW